MRVSAKISRMSKRRQKVAMAHQFLQFVESSIREQLLNNFNHKKIGEVTPDQIRTSILQLADRAEEILVNAQEYIEIDGGRISEPLPGYGVAVGGKIIPVPRNCFVSHSDTLTK